MTSEEIFPVLTTPPRLSHQDLQAYKTRWPRAAAFVTIAPSKGTEQPHFVRDLRQRRKSVQEVRLGDRLSWPILFTSPARHDGARLEQIGGKNAVADRLYVSTTHKSCSPPGAVFALFGEHAIDWLALRARAWERIHPERRLHVANAAVGRRK